MGRNKTSAGAADRDMDLVVARAAAQPTAAAAAAMALASTTETAAKLVAASKSPRTLAQYASALRGWDGWRADHGLAEDDRAAALYLAHLSDLGRAASSAATFAAAAKLRASSHGRRSPIGRAAQAALQGFRRTAAKEGRGRGQAQPLSYDDVLTIQALAAQPRKRGRGLETAAVAAKRGRLDSVLVGLAFMAGMRRSEIAALTWDDVAEAEGGMLVRLRTSKTNQTGETADLRFVKNGTAAALRALRDAGSGQGPVAGGLSPKTVGRRIAAAAKVAGIKGRITGHSGRIGLASELVSRGASTADVMRAGGWKTARMVSHYAAGAAAQNGAVARYL